MNKDYGIDGCSAPQYGFKIKNLGKALRNLYKSYKGNNEYAKDVKMMINSINENPMFIGGNNNLDSNLIKISNKKIFAKVALREFFIFTFKKRFLNFKSCRW